MWLAEPATANTKISPFRGHFVGYALGLALPS
jgi:hypothetical protein